MKNLDVSNLTDGELDQLVAEHEEWERWKVRAKFALGTTVTIIVIVAAWLLDLVDYLR